MRTFLLLLGIYFCISCTESTNQEIRESSLIFSSIDSIFSTLNLKNQDKVNILGYIDNNGAGSIEWIKNNGNTEKNKSIKKIISLLSDSLNFERRKDTLKKFNSEDEIYNLIKTKVGKTYINKLPPTDATMTILYSNLYEWDKEGKAMYLAINSGDIRSGGFVLLEIENKVYTRRVWH